MNTDNYAYCIFRAILLYYPLLAMHELKAKYEV